MLNELLVFYLKITDNFVTNISVRQKQRRGRERKPTCPFVVIAVSGYSDKMLAINLLLRMNIIAFTCSFYSKNC